jgi:hypothetical protein
VDNYSEKSLGWLVIPPQETAVFMVKTDSLQELVKHYSRRERRLYNCFGVTCDFCMSGIPKRRRYRVDVIFHGKKWTWEFGKQVYRRVKELAGDDAEFMIIVTRIGEGRSTRYWITRASEVIQERERQRYIQIYIGGRLRI